MSLRETSTRSPLARRDMRTSFPREEVEEGWDGMGAWVVVLGFYLIMFFRISANSSFVFTAFAFGAASS